jgi:hypothetical protein
VALIPAPHDGRDAERHAFDDAAATATAARAAKAPVVAGRCTSIINGDGQLGDAEPSPRPTTPALRLHGLAAGTYAVNVVLPDGFERTTAKYRPHARSASKLANVALGIVRPPALGSISGVFFDDVNLDGTRQTGEAGHSIKELLPRPRQQRHVRRRRARARSPPATARSCSRDSPPATTPSPKRRRLAGDDDPPTPVTVTAYETRYRPGRRGRAARHARRRRLQRPRQQRHPAARGTPAAGVQVYIDANGNGQSTTGERTTTDRRERRVRLHELKYGTYGVRAVPPAGRTLSTGTQFHTLYSGQTYTGLKLGLGVASNTAAGDAAERGRDQRRLLQRRQRQPLARSRPSRA